MDGKRRGQYVVTLDSPGPDPKQPIHAKSYVTNLYLRLRYSRNGVLDFKVTVIVGSQE